MADTSLAISNYSQAITATTNGGGSFEVNYFGSGSGEFNQWLASGFAHGFKVYSSELYAETNGGSAWNALDGRSFSLANASTISFSDNNTYSISALANADSMISFTVVPEPSTCAAAAGIAVLGFAALRRRRK